MTFQIYEWSSKSHSGPVILFEGTSTECSAWLANRKASGTPDPVGGFGLLAPPSVVTRLIESQVNGGLVE
jgi:hypothetical protein